MTVFGFSESEASSRNRWENTLQSSRYLDPEDRMFNSDILDIFVVLRDTTLTISDSIETGSPSISQHSCRSLLSP